MENNYASCKNLICAELFRLKKMKSFRVCAIIAAFFGILNLLLVRGAYKSDFGAEIVLGRTIDENLWYIIGIMVAIYISKEYSDKTIRQIVSKNLSRNVIFFSRYVCVVVATSIIVLINFICQFVLGAILYGVKANPDVKSLSYGLLYGVDDAICEFDVAFVIKFILWTIIFILIMAAVATLVVSFLKNTGISIAIILCIGIFSIVFEALAKYTKHESLKYYNFTKGFYKILYNSPKSNGYFEIVCIMVLYLVLSIFIGMLIFKKQEV